MDDALDRVVPLDQLKDFEIAEGDPDIRGWEVHSADGRRIGQVDDLLVDRLAMKVRYLDIDLEDEVDPAGEDRHILVPIGYARLDEEEDRVMVDSLTRADLAAMPLYDHAPMTREYETTLRSRYGREEIDRDEAEDFYASDLYDSDRFYGRRRGSRGNPLA